MIINVCFSVAISVVNWILPCLQIGSFEIPWFLWPIHFPPLDVNLEKFQVFYECIHRKLEITLTVPLDNSFPPIDVDLFNAQRLTTFPRFSSLNSFQKLINEYRVKSLKLSVISTKSVALCKPKY